MSDKVGLSAVETLGDAHNLDDFDCGQHTSLTDWLKRFARINQQGKSAQTYVVHRTQRVVGYYALSAASVKKSEASARAAKGQPGHPIPVILLARLAVDKTEQGQGLGKALLKDAVQRCVQASDAIGARAVLVHAIDDEAKAFYSRFGFESCPIDDLHLMLLMKDIPATPT